MIEYPTVMYAIYSATRNRFVYKIDTQCFPIMIRTSKNHVLTFKGYNQAKKYFDRVDRLSAYKNEYKLVRVKRIEFEEA